MTPTPKKQMQIETAPDDETLKKELLSAIIKLSPNNQKKLWKELYNLEIIKK